MNTTPKKLSLSPKQSKICLVTSIALVFTILMIIGTIWDFDIAKLLTKNSLPTNSYYSTSAFALTIEAVGGSPIWLSLGFAFAILFWLFAKSKQNYWLRLLLSFCCSVVGVIVCYMFVNDTLKYLTEQNGVQSIMQAKGVFDAVLFVGTLIWFLILFVTKYFKADKKKLQGFALVIICTAALYLLVSLIKTPFGRVRYRTLNFLQDESLFTPWYKPNGARSFPNLANDSCKSFPSGHTFSAGLTYVLLCLPNVWQRFDTKKVKLILWTISVCVTATVALGRMIAGAHYLTDVVFGGTMSLVGVLVFKKIFLPTPVTECQKGQKTVALA